jgi:hypothetical protein
MMLRHTFGDADGEQRIRRCAVLARVAHRRYRRSRRQKSVGTEEMGER